MDFVAARQRMVTAQIAGRGVRDARVLEAMATVPRENFVGEGSEEFAYEDSPLPISEGQTISQPYIVAAMLEAAKLKQTDRVLEVGAGSGYATALISRLAAKVYAIERHAALTKSAQERLQALCYDNVELKTGDGSKGWPSNAPFDAIIVSAGGPRIPQSLKTQLAIGGRLIIPIGPMDKQELVRLTRGDKSDFAQEDLGAVRFVKLIGVGGWHDGGAAKSGSPLNLPERIGRAAEMLPSFAEGGFGRLFDRWGDKKLVLLGEESHGTSEFYRARAAITARLVGEHGFNLVTVEADWPDAATIHRQVLGLPPNSNPPAFQRFPRWMWKNRDVAAFVGWLRQHNGSSAAPCGFYGLDMYNMRAAIAQVLAYLDRVDPGAARVARERYACLTPWQREPETYGRAVLTEGYRKCEDAVTRQCREMLEQEFAYAQNDREEFLDATQNARLIASAERYYRVMYYGGTEAWNLRDRHMFETLTQLLDWRGSCAKAVVWAHNSHIGDARQTAMGQISGEWNIGQLCRERFGQDCALIGMGTNKGTVAAASQWDGAMETMDVVPARADSVGRLCHEAGLPCFLLDFVKDQTLSRALAEPRLERFIGVIYRPQSELQSHYAEACLSRQFDAYLWFDETRAVEETGPEQYVGVPDTFPFGV